MLIIMTTKSKSNRPLKMETGFVGVVQNTVNHAVALAKSAEHERYYDTTTTTSIGIYNNVLKIGQYHQSEFYPSLSAELFPEGKFKILFVDMEKTFIKPGWLADVDMLFKKLQQKEARRLRRK